MVIRHRRALTSTLRRLVVLMDKTLGWAMPGYCTFCLASVDGQKPWCAQCHHELPWHGSGCRLCSEPLPERMPEGAICGRCLERRPAFDESWAPFLYQGQVARLVQRFKFQGDRRAGYVLLRLMAQSLEYELTTRRRPWPEAIVIANLHDVRARERGFDQSLWIGKGLMRQLALPLYTAQRLRQTPSQRGLSRQARRRNVRHIYRLDEALPANVLLFDDVMTTGATLDALASACREAGALHVMACAIARTPPVRAI